MEVMGLLRNRTGLTANALREELQAVTHPDVRAGAAALPEKEGTLCHSIIITLIYGSTHRRAEANNPGNNLHVSGLSKQVDTRELEQAFAKVGRVRISFSSL